MKLFVVCTLDGVWCWIYIAKYCNSEKSRSRSWKRNLKEWLNSNYETVIDIGLFVIYYWTNLWNMKVANYRYSRFLAIHDNTSNINTNVNKYGMIIYELTNADYRSFLSHPSADESYQWLEQLDCVSIKSFLKPSSLLYDTVHRTIHAKRLSTNYSTW